MGDTRPGIFDEVIHATPTRYSEVVLTSSPCDREVLTIALDQMKDDRQQPDPSNSEREEERSKIPRLLVGVDYYYEGGLMVLTEHFLKRRGYCCENGCRHCPYGFVREK